MSDLEFNLSRSLKVKSSGAFGLPIYDFLLVYNRNYMSISHHLGVMATRKIFNFFWTQKSKILTLIKPCHAKHGRGLINAAMS